MRLVPLTLTLVLCAAAPLGAAHAGEECYSLPEVRAYLDIVRLRTQERWKLPPQVPPDSSITMKFRIETAGVVAELSLVGSPSRALGLSAIAALNSASPFPAMGEEVRCLAREPITATFRNPIRP